MKRNHDPRLTLNAVPVHFDPTVSLLVGRLPFSTREGLDALRDEFRGVLLIRRAQGDRIEAVSRRAGVDPPGERVQVSARDAPHLVAGLLREWLLDFLVDKGRPVALRRHRLILYSTKPEDDLLQASRPHGVELPGSIGVRVVFEFDDRVVPRGDGTRDIMLVCEAYSRIILDMPVSELLSRGIAVKGLYVRKNDPRRDSRLLPHRGLVGCVRAVSADSLVLDDHIDSQESIPAADALLEPRSENLDRVVRALVPTFADKILSGLARRKATVASGPDRLVRIKSVFNFLAQQTPEIAPGLRVDFGSLISSKENHFPMFEIVQKPELIFDLGGRKTHRWNQGGLDTYGPSDRYHFTPKALNIAVICQAAKKGRVEQFVERLLKGLPSKAGFLRRFALEQPFVKVFTGRTSVASEYRLACAEALEWITDNGKRWNLVLVQIDEGMDALVGDENPYLVTKAFFLSRNVGVQDVELETMEQGPDQLVYTLNNIGLASYAKLGGVPWLLPADRTVAHEVVIGLGSYQSTTTRLGSSERFVGITTVFTGDGRYLLESRTRAVPFGEYTGEMLRAIRRAVDQVKEEQNWGMQDPIRLVFHAFKPLKAAEADAVKALMHDLGYPHAEFAFVHVVDNHPFLVFDETEAGAPAPRGSRKGVLAPPRGLAVRLSSSEMLLALKGANDVKQASDGLPRAVVLKLHRDSSFRDLIYLSRQVFAFSCHSWRSFFPAPMPITIGYSQLIAEKLRLLQDVSDWSAEDILGPIGRTLWFL